MRRGILDDDGTEKGYYKGAIVGWLPCEQADFVSETTGLPAALWRVRYDEVVEEVIRLPPSGRDEEDLERHEVEEGLQSYVEEDDDPSWYKVRVRV